MGSLHKTKLIDVIEQRLQRELSNHVTKHEGQSLKSQHVLRTITNDLLATTEHQLGGVSEARSNVQTSVAQLPKLKCAIIEGDGAQESKVPFSSLVGFIMERKRTLKWNGVQWHRTSYSIPRSLPLIIRGYKKRNNMGDVEKNMGRRTGNVSETHTDSRKPLQNSTEDSTFKNYKSSDWDGDGETLSASPCPVSVLEQISKSTSPKHCKVGTKLPGRSQTERGNHYHDEDVKLVKSVKSSAGSVANMNWPKGCKRKLAVGQRLPPIALCSEAENSRSGLSVSGSSCRKFQTVPSERKSKPISSKRFEQPIPGKGCRSELKQISSQSYLEDASQELEMEHRSVSQAKNRVTDTGSHRLCFDDDSAENGESVIGEKATDTDFIQQVGPKMTFHCPVVFPVTLSCDKPEEKSNTTAKQPDGKLQRTVLNSSLATCLSKMSYASKTSTSYSRASKSSDNKSKVSQSTSQGTEECLISDLIDVVHEKSKSLHIDPGRAVPLVKGDARYHRQRQPLKSSMKKTFDWRGHSQRIVEEPKATKDTKLNTVKKDLDTNVEKSSPNKQQARKTFRPLDLASSQIVQVCAYSLLEKSTELCIQFNCCPQQCLKFVHHSPPLAQQQQNQPNPLPGTMQQHDSSQLKPTVNIELAMDTNATLDCYYCPNYNVQIHRNQNHLRLPESVELMWSKASPLPERTIELSSSCGGKVPKITMTCPTPIPDKQ
eukprot:gi/632973498/ref/XP_007903184.1/ PREDICTED: micronuclear linker histone polyprotein-like [Callorhinchus milii]